MSSRRRQARSFAALGSLEDGGRRRRRIQLLPAARRFGGDKLASPKPRRRRAATPKQANAAATRLYAGPLRVTFRIALELSLPAGARADRRSVRHKHGRRADPNRRDARRRLAARDLRGHGREHGARSPTADAVSDRRLTVASARADTAFDVVTRPARREVPAQPGNEAPVSSPPMMSVVDAGDDRAGATVIAKGLNEYEILQAEVRSQKSVRLVARSQLTLIRAVGDLSRNDLATRPSGHAGPPVATPAAQCRSPSVRRSRSSREAPARGCPDCSRAHARCTVPPRVVVARKPGGRAPTRRSFLRSIDSRRRRPERAEEGRRSRQRHRPAVQPWRRGRDATLRPRQPVTQAFAVNFLEERSRSRGCRGRHGRSAARAAPDSDDRAVLRLREVVASSSCFRDFVVPFVLIRLLPVAVERQLQRAGPRIRGRPRQIVVAKREHLVHAREAHGRRLRRLTPPSAAANTRETGRRQARLRSPEARPRP